MSGWLWQFGDTRWDTYLLLSAKKKVHNEWMVYVEIDYFYLNPTKPVIIYSGMQFITVHSLAASPPMIADSIVHLIDQLVCQWISGSVSQWISESLTHSLTHSRSCSVARSLAHSLARSLTRTRSFTCVLASLTNWPICPLVSGYMHVVCHSMYWQIVQYKLSCCYGVDT